MGKTDAPNTNRYVVVFYAPLIYLIALSLIALKENVIDHLSISKIFYIFPLVLISITMSLAQQAQFWGVRRIMRKHG